MNRSIKGVAFLTALAIGVSGCATHSSSIAPQHVSSMKYERVDCHRLQLERESISNRLRALSASQDSSANGDAALMGVGLILFWPALLALPATGGGKAQEAEIARLKGEQQALDEAIVMQCSGSIPPAPRNIMQPTAASY